LKRKRQIYQRKTTEDK
jgi:hypothetical protein